RDIIAISLLLILSGCYPKIYGTYMGKKVWPNLYGIIGGPPASGKSAMLLAKSIGDKIHAELEKGGKENRAEYRAKLAEWNENQIGPEPEKPKLKLFFLPGNSSAAGMLQLLSANDGRGVIVETEVDTMVLMFGQKFGDYSDILRKAFHHEHISSFRK